ncbi:MAG: hypothetical protein NPIRA04_15680 [Nitrospirales bacterium]|nr:MAG: hypothetical protein NPIRA04_15680 [Nitrospirales bacterium]
MASSHRVFLFDIDNTLIDNDHVKEDLRRFLDSAVGVECQSHYWEIFENLRAELGYADYLGALQQYRMTYGSDPQLLPVSSFLVDYPFEDRVFPQSFEVIEQCKKWGTVVILSDGDVVFQPRKIERSGLLKAVDGHVLIYIHKEQELDDVRRRYPAEHYILVDDKLRILTMIKAAWGSQVTTVFPRQGHYANDPQVLKRYPSADITIDRIGSLLNDEWAPRLWHKEIP